MCISKVVALNFHSSANQGMLNCSAIFQQLVSKSKLLIFVIITFASNNKVANVAYQPAHKKTIPKSGQCSSTFCTSQSLLLIWPADKQSLLNLGLSST